MDNKTLPKGIEFDLIKKISEEFLPITFDRKITDDDVLHFAGYLTNCLGYTTPVPYLRDEYLNILDFAISPYEGSTIDSVSGMIKNISIIKPHFTFTKYDKCTKISIIRHTNEENITMDMLIKYLKPN